MADGLPPPPSYSSLFQGGDSSQASPSVPPAEDAPHHAPQIGAVGKSSSRSMSRQTSLESPYPPSHPFYPGPQGLPSPDDGAAAQPTAPQAPGYYGGGSGGPPQDSIPEKPPLNETSYPPPPNAGAQGYGPPGAYPQPGPGGYPPPTGGAYPPPTGGAYPPPSGGSYPPHPGGAASNYPYPSPQGAPQPYPASTDPLINPGAPGPFGPYYSGSGQYPPPVAPQEIPVIIEDMPDIPVNPNAPAECVLGTLEEYPDLQIAEGQREHIDQLDPHEEPALAKWCCVAFWSIGAHVCFAVCIFLLIWQVPLKQRYDAWWSQASRADRSYGPEGIGYNSATLICASVFLVLCYLIAVIEGCASDTDTYVQNVSQLAEFRQDHNKLRSQVPTVIWRAEAYHEAKERIEWKNGRIVSRRRSSDTHKCVTYKEEIAFPFSKCVDASGDFAAFKKGVINRIEFEKTFGFLDAATAAEYKRRKEEIIERVKHKDENHDFEEVLSMPEMKDRATVYMEEGCRTAFISSSFYNCLTCILCTWPYRIFFRLSTKKRKYTYVKLIGI